MPCGATGCGRDQLGPERYALCEQDRKHDQAEGQVHQDAAGVDEEARADALRVQVTRPWTVRGREIVRTRARDLLLALLSSRPLPALLGGFVSGHLHVAAERHHGDLIDRLPAAEAHERGAEAQAEHQHVDLADARGDEVPGLVNEDHEADAEDDLQHSEEIGEVHSWFVGGRRARRGSRRAPRPRSGRGPGPRRRPPADAGADFSPSALFWPATSSGVWSSAASGASGGSV